jgi:tetratricopeptide (TPR) repeat protein
LQDADGLLAIPVDSGAPGHYGHATAFVDLEHGHLRHQRGGEWALMTTPSSEQRPLLVHRASEMLQLGAWAEAQMLLMAALDPAAQPDVPDEVTFLAMRLLGQLTRQRGDLAQAEQIYLAANGVAETLGRADLESAALEGLATVAQAESDPEQAISLYRMAEQKARAAGDEIGRAAVLGKPGSCSRPNAAL